MKESLSTLFRSRLLKSVLLLAFTSLVLFSCGSDSDGGQSQPFELLEATIEVPTCLTHPKLNHRAVCGA